MRRFTRRPYFKANILCHFIYPQILLLFSRYNQYISLSVGQFSSSFPSSASHKRAPPSLEDFAFNLPEVARCGSLPRYPLSLKLVVRLTSFALRLAWGAGCITVVRNNKFSRLSIAELLLILILDHRYFCRTRFSSLVYIL